MRVLERGYTIVRGPDGEPIVRASGLEPGMAFEVQFAHDQRRGAVATGEPVAGVAPAAAGDAASEPAETEPPKPRAKRRPAAKAAEEDQGTLF
jgi:exodeoxyribonuclease VII large subunit